MHAAGGDQVDLNRRKPVRSRTVRDPLWQNIRLGAEAAAIVDTPEFQRLRRVKQLGFAHLVYPGAVHTRFLHALGVYHLTDRAIEILAGSGILDELSEADRRTIPVVRLAALLHDVGHYAFSHAMEELEPTTIPGHHEDMAGRFLGSSEIRSILCEVDPDAPAMISELIRGVSSHPLQGLVSGSLDLDKIDYLRRDSLFCGVPYGAVDVERLLNSLTLARDEEGGLEVAVTEKGVSALESLLFAKYQMFRNVYWHHAVRSATVAFRGLIETALEAGLLTSGELPGRTDEELLGIIGTRLRDEDAPPILGTLLAALVNRRLPKRVIEVSAEDLSAPVANWVSERGEPVRRAELMLADEWGVESGSIFIDYPANPSMLELELLLVRRSGEVQRLTSRGERGLIDLPRLGRSLLRTTRVLRVFSLHEVGERDALSVLARVTGDVPLVRSD